MKQSRYNKIKQPKYNKITGELLLEIVDTIDEVGWTRWHLEDDNGVCLVGAYNRVQYGAATPHLGMGSYHLFVEFQTALDVGDAMVWNDSQPYAGIVTMRLREAARAMRHKEAVARMKTARRELKDTLVENTQFVCEAEWVEAPQREPVKRKEGASAGFLSGGKVKESV